MAEPIEFTVYPDECDAFGHLNQASYLALFERARWALLARGPGMDAFSRAGVWPVVRRGEVEFHASAWPGDVLRFETAMIHRGRTSFSMRQSAVRTSDQRLIATAELLFVCIDQDHHPVPIPESILLSIRGVARRLTLATGVTLAVEESGQGGIPLLLVHGYPLDRSMWAMQLSGLRGHRVIAPDLRGFGESDLPDAPTSMSTYADDLAALLDVLGIDRAVIGGFSMGGYIAIEFARRHPQRLAGLALLDTRAEPDSMEGRAGRDAAIHTAQTAGATAIADAMAAKLFAAATPPELRAPLVARMREAPVAGIVAALVAMRDRLDGTAVLEGLGDLPTLVVVGAEDQLTPPSAARQIASARPGSRLVEVAGAGHAAPVEQPAAVTEALQRFLDGVV